MGLSIFFLRALKQLVVIGGFNFRFHSISAANEKLGQPLQL